MSTTLVQTSEIKSGRSSPVSSINFNKLEERALWNYIGHHNIQKVRQNASPQELAQACTSHFENWEVDEEHVLQHFSMTLVGGSNTRELRAPFFGSNIGVAGSRKRNRDEFVPYPKGFADGYSVGYSADGYSGNVFGASAGNFAGNFGGNGSGNGNSNGHGNGHHERSERSHRHHQTYHGDRVSNGGREKTYHAQGHSNSGGGHSHRSHHQQQQQQQQQHAPAPQEPPRRIPPGELVALKGTETNDKGELIWILARVVKFHESEGKYEVQDVDPGGKEEQTANLKKSQAELRELSDKADNFNKGDKVVAVFPETTSFYRGQVSKAVKRGATEISIQFEEDEDQDTGMTPHRRVPVKHVMPPPEG